MKGRREDKSYATTTTFDSESRRFGSAAVEHPFLTASHDTIATTPDVRTSGPKAYWIAHIPLLQAHDNDAYHALFPAMMADHGGRVIVHGGTQVVLEGTPKAMTIIAEFPTLAAARAFHDSPDHAAARRKDRLDSLADIIIVEGI